MIRPLRPIAATVLMLASAHAGETTIDGRVFKLPDGFTIDRVAGPPMVDRPIVADFDEQGRLYIADSSGSNDNVQKQLVDRPHRIVRLEDTNGDGRFDKRTVFADRMMFPAGAMWRDGSLYVSAPPSIWKLTDTDGDGVADLRVEWFKGKTLTGCANDLHGPYDGPDGWIYWCKGAFARQTYERPGKPPFTTRAAHIFRARPDGTGIEPVMTGGMDNPVDVVFTPGGERIFTTTFLQHPGGGRRDGLIHAVYGGVYGKVHDVIDEHKRTGPDVMPVMTHLGPAAPCGLVRYESETFGPLFKDNLFVCQFNMRKVSRHILIPDGATFKTEDHEFLSSTDGDFHPTDVIEDADGSLLVIDTGGWYKLCCPTSQLEKPDILGAIYRIRRVGGNTVVDPRGLLLDWTKTAVADLATRLGDPRPAVRKRAVAAIATRGKEALPDLARIVEAGPPTVAALSAIWAATRIDDPGARAIVRIGLSYPDESVQQAALNSISLWRDAEAFKAVETVLDYRLPQLKMPRQTPQNFRLAIEALGRIGGKGAAAKVMVAMMRSDIRDRVYEHAVTFAMIESGDPGIPRVWGLGESNPIRRRLAMTALDQMENGGLTVGDAVSGLVADDPALRATSAWIIGRHPDWAGATAGVIELRLKSSLTDAERSEVEDHLARFAGSVPIQDLISRTLTEIKTPVRASASVLRAIAHSHLKTTPLGWVDGLETQLEMENPEQVSLAIAAARSLSADGIAKLVIPLYGAGRSKDLPASLRLEALAAMGRGFNDENDPDTFALLRDSLAPGRPVVDRLNAADVIARSDLSTEHLGIIADLMATAGPMEVNRLLDAFAKSSDAPTGLRLISALEKSPSLNALRPETIRPKIAKFPAEVHARAEALYARLNVDASKQQARVNELVATLGVGDVRRGQAVFNGPKAACLSCHAIGYVGGDIGPDLTKIGAVRVDRDLIEAIVYPSASFVRSYEPMLVLTRDGRSMNGVVRGDTSDEIVLATGPSTLTKIARRDIEEVRPGTVSVMPGGLDQQLSRQEFADLIAFLKSRR